jgi:hypothetical protein
MMTLGMAAPLVFAARETQANRALLWAVPTLLDVFKQLWQVMEPTNGLINIQNTTNNTREGDVYFYVTGLDGQEDLRYFSYAVPPYTENTYQFFNGPYGTFPGQKTLWAQTARGQNQTNLVVEA